MVQRVKLNYINSKLEIGMASWKEVFLLQPVIKPLQAETDRGRLVYRAKGSNRRYSYSQIKKGLIKQEHFINIEVPNQILP